MRPAAICFDLDDTLLDHAGQEEALAAACRELAEVRPDLTSEALLETNRVTWGEYWPQAEPAWISGRLDTATLAREAWGATLRALGHGDEQLAVLAGEIHARHSRAAYRLFDDAVQALEAARAAGLATALVTNGAGDVQWGKVRALGIEPWFDTVVVSGEVGDAKPAAAPFRRALDALGVDAAAAWHVGDGLDTDVAGANRAGLTSVWLNRHGRARADGAEEPDIEIETLRRLAELLA